MDMTIQCISNKNTFRRLRNRLEFYQIPKCANRIRLNTSHSRYESPKRVRQEVSFKAYTDEFDSFEFKMLYCPKGILDKGHDTNYRSDVSNYNPNQMEKILRKKAVIKKPFLLGEVEVTKDFFASLKPKLVTYGWRQRNTPIEGITWFDAIHFCNFLSEFFDRDLYYNISNPTTGYYGLENKKNITSANVTFNRNANGFRLPTLDEWEYAARAGTRNRWAGTDKSEEVKYFAWVGEEMGSMKSSPIGGKLPNEWGFYDMTGNVWEMCGEYVVDSKMSILGIDEFYTLIRGGSSDKSSNECEIARLDEGRAISASSCMSRVGFRIAASI